MAGNLKHLTWMLLVALGLVGCGTGEINCAFSEAAVDVFSSQSRVFIIRKQDGNSWEHALTSTVDDQTRVCLKTGELYQLRLASREYFEFATQPSKITFVSTGPGGAVPKLSTPQEIVQVNIDRPPDGTLSAPDPYFGGQSQTAVPDPVPTPAQAPPVPTPAQAPPVPTPDQAPGGGGTTIICQSGATCLGGSAGNVVGTGIGEVNN